MRTVLKIIAGIVGGILATIVILVVWMVIAESCIPQAKIEGGSRHWRQRWSNCTRNCRTTRTGYFGWSRGLIIWMT